MFFAFSLFNIPLLKMDEVFFFFKKMYALQVLTKIKVKTLLLEVQLNKHLNMTLTVCLCTI